MADTEVFFPSKYAGRLTNHGTLPAQANVKYPSGTLVARDANGRAARPGNGLSCHGISEGEFDNTASGHTGVAGANDAMNVELAYGVGVFDYTNTAPKAGEIVFAVDNHTVDLSSNSGVRGVAGIASETGAGGKVAVSVDPLINSLLQRLLAAVYLLENVGTNGQVIKSNGTVAAWAADAT